MAVIQFAARRRRRSGVGIATAADAQAKQADVRAFLDQINSMVKSCDASIVNDPTYTEWLAEQTKVFAYLALEPGLLDAGTIVTTGDQLLAELKTWSTTLAALPECKGKPVPQPPAPTPKPAPGGGGLGGLLGNVQNIELILGIIAFAWFMENRRG